MVAMITSVTPSRSTRSRSSCTRRSSGPIPSSGLIAPPRTWYRPLITPAFSTVAMSLGSSTTQSTVRSRPPSRQIRQSSPSATLPHSRQKKIRSFALTSLARRFASSGSFHEWKASRCAAWARCPETESRRSGRDGPSYPRRRPRSRAWRRARQRDARAPLSDSAHPRPLGGTAPLGITQLSRRVRTGTARLQSSPRSITFERRRSSGGKTSSARP